MDILRLETLCLNICFIPISPTLQGTTLTKFEFLSFFFGGDGTPTHPLKILKNVPVVIAYNIQKQNNYRVS